MFGSISQLNSILIWFEPADGFSSPINLRAELEKVCLRAHHFSILHFFGLFCISEHPSSHHSIGRLVMVLAARVKHGYVLLADGPRFDQLRQSGMPSTSRPNNGHLRMITAAGDLVCCICMGLFTTECSWKCSIYWSAIEHLGVCGENCKIGIL